MENVTLETFKGNELKKDQIRHVYGGGGGKLLEIDEFGNPIGGENNGDSSNGGLPEDPTSNN